MRRCALLLLITACASAPATTPAPKAAAAPKLVDALAPIAFFVGTWVATIEDPKDGKRRTLRYVVTPTLGGRWLSGAGKLHELDLEIHDLWGVDPQSGGVLRLIVDSKGLYGTVRSKGWEGDKLVFVGAAAGDGVRLEVRETITRVGPDRFTAVWEAKLPDGWTAYSIEDLRRQ